MCDTFVALPSATPDRSIIFGKNSDREPNEAQALEFIPENKHEKASQLKTTYLPIPQAEETYSVLLSRPFWMWGAEIGANHKGVVIGNEAVWSRMPLNKKAGLTGMDLLRLALERGGSAQDAILVIVKMLADFGQGGICGYHDKKMAYHNSYIIADPKEAWVMETAAHLWAARQVKDAASISNGLTIGKSFDLHHPDLISTARKKGWLKKGEIFHFAHAYRDRFYTTFSASEKRRSRSLDLLKKRLGAVDVAYAFRVLRDHNGDDYLPDRHFLGNRICAHAANPLARKATQTTSSLVAHIRPEDLTIWATGTSAPCTGIFKPMRFQGTHLPGVSQIGPIPKELFDPKTLWWRHERLHREVLRDFRPRLRSYSAERDTLEAKFLAEAVEKNGRAAPLDSVFTEASEAGDRWLEKVRAVDVRRKPDLIYRRFWNNQNREAGIPIDPH